MWVDLSKFRDCRIVMANDAAGVRREGVFIPFLQNGVMITKNGNPLMSMLVLRLREEHWRGKRKHVVLLRHCRASIIEMMKQGLVDLRNLEKSHQILENCIHNEPIGYAFPRRDKDGTFV